MNTDQVETPDSHVQRDVLEELAWTAEIDGSRIAVSVADGVVTLSGQINSYSQRYTAVKAALRVAGVRVVVDELEVRHSVHDHTDAGLEALIRSVLDSSIRVPADAIQVQVHDGVATLTGAVEHEYQRRAASKAVGSVAGVRSVDSRISLIDRVARADTQQLIEKALVRHALLDAHAIHVTATGTEVTLTGEVPTWFEREEAVRAAWNSPHVSAVHDKITVTG